MDQEMKGPVTETEKKMPEKTQNWNPQGEEKRKNMEQKRKKEYGTKDQMDYR
jgi:hypothetical protein